jgi:hypothetical protein
MTPLMWWKSTENVLFIMEEGLWHRQDSDNRQDLDVRRPQISGLEYSGGMRTASQMSHIDLLRGIKAIEITLHCKEKTIDRTGAEAGSG